MLDRETRRALVGLTDEGAEEVARRLVACAMLLEDEPALALQHAREAKRRGSRIGVVREAAGVAAYRNGEFAEARRELQTARRMTGAPDLIPILADCERALGHPDRALAFLDDADAARLDVDSAVELLIVASGALRDMGNPSEALSLLERQRLLTAPGLHPWTVRLWYAYAEALLAAGRQDEARTWFERVAEIDDDYDTDAAERVTAWEPPSSA